MTEPKDRKLTLTEKRAISIELHRCRETLRENRLVLDVIRRIAEGDIPRKKHRVR